MLVITVDAWFAPGALAFLAGFLLSARFPEAQLYLSTCANLAFTINGVIRWRPTSFAMTEKERVWLDERVRNRRDARAGRRPPAAGGPAPTSTGGSD
jgi:hypothetical protein